MSEPYRARVREGESKIEDLSTTSVVHSTRVEHARRDLISAQIDALIEAERRGTISTLVASEVLHGLDKALGLSEFKQEEIQDASRTEEPVEPLADVEVSEALIPESTESIVGPLSDGAEEE